MPQSKPPAALPWAAVFLMALAVGCNSDPSEKSIDLNRSTAFVRSGLATPGSLDLDSGWLRLSGSSSGARRIRIHELPIPGKPQRQALQWFDRDMSYFSIAIPFQIESDQDFRSPAIRFAEIGERWAVYLNGHLVYSNLATKEVHPESLTRRDVIIPLDVRNLQSGANTLLLQIQGDPVNMETGLYYDGPYRIDEYENLVNRAEAVDLALIAIYLSIGLFHILFFLQKKQERFNVYFGLFSVLMAIWLFTRSSYIYYWIQDYFWTLRLETAALYLLLPVFGSFIQAIQGRGHPWFIRTLWALHLILLLALFMPSENLIQDLLVYWRFIAPIFLLYYLIVIPRRFWRYVRSFRNRYSLFSSFEKSLLNTVPGNLLLGTIIIVFASLLDLANASQGRGNQLTTGYLFLFFVGGSALRIANRLLLLNDLVESLNRRLRQNLNQLNSTNTRLMASERRYRHLIDGSRDIILSLNKDGIIVLASRATRSELGVGPDDLQGRHIETLIHGDPSDQFRTLEFFRERFEVFQKEKESLQMKIPVVRRNETQPGQFQLTLQKMQSDQDVEVLGRLVSLKEDYLLQFLDKEQLTFSLSNELVAVEELSQRLVRNLTRYIDSSQAGMIRIGLREILINAIEHGNLAITYEEKSRELSTGNYSEFIALRQTHPDYRGRTATVDYNLDDSGVIYRIQDQGSGFNHDTLASRLAIPESGELPLHGRGIMITRNAFDLVEYNDKGNEVRLVKYFR